MQNVYEKQFFYFYFFNVDISLIVHDPHLKLYICKKNIAVELPVSQICYIGPSLFSIKFRNKYAYKNSDHKVHYQLRYGRPNNKSQKIIFPPYLYIYPQN